MYGEGGKSPHSSLSGFAVTLSLIEVSKESIACHVGWVLRIQYLQLSGPF